MGLGFFISSQGDQPMIVHSGEHAEATSYLMLFPKTKDAIVVLCNCGYAEPGQIAHAVVDALNAR
jgi:hypothetical protein